VLHHVLQERKMPFTLNKKLLASGLLLLPKLAAAEPLNQANTAWILTSTW